MTDTTLQAGDLVWTHALPGVWEFSPSRKGLHAILRPAGLVATIELTRPWRATGLPWTTVPIDRVHRLVFPAPQETP